MMRRVKSSGTKAERALRSAVWQLGLRYRVGPIDVPGRPDLVFRRARVAVFVDGAFWHGKKLSAARLSEMSSYWQSKIRRNMDRDALVNAELAERSWTIIRIDSSLAERNAAEMAAYVRSVLKNGLQDEPPVGVSVVAADSVT